jgi:hypothetical protein
MLRRVLATVGIGAVALVAAAPAGAQTSSRKTPRGVGVLIPARKGERLPTRGGTAYSLNWSGYAVTPAKGITAVTSAYTVPSAGFDPPGFAATWTGIGGYNTTDLIQAGTAEDSVPSNPLLGSQYYAWYELLPNSETPITGCKGDAACTVSPGQRMTVRIKDVRGNTWSVSLTDRGRWSWSRRVTYVSSRSSAEWILEAPTVAAQTLLAGVGTQHFGPTSTFTRAGKTRTIARGKPTKIVLSPSPVGGLNEATPSGLAGNGQSFNDCAYRSTCPTP